MAKKSHLYFDDIGSRYPDRKPPVEGGRHDGMDCFGFGGILVNEEDIDTIFAAHKAFCMEWGIDYPLHSRMIRGHRGKFGWLRKPGNAASFLNALEAYLLSLPFVGIACIVHRPGYFDRYKDRYQERLWLMCKTAYAILIERSAKFSEAQGRNLEVLFEMSGKKEDENIIKYTKELKMKGSLFSSETSNDYKPFSAADFRRVVLGDPRQLTKNSPMIQIADLTLYPMAKGRYDPGYRPYRKLMEGGKLIDCHLSKEEQPFLGIKYSCFDDVGAINE